MRRIDHIVVAVRHLDEAAEFYQRLGFQVGARNRHPWGTENRLIQFGSSFIELITVGTNAGLIPPHSERHFSFGAFVREYLQQREGLAMLVLSSDDAQRDARLFAERGIGDFEVFSFERSGVGPDGAKTRVAFSLAFARDADAPTAGFFVCQHHLPENFWDARFQVHANRARNISAVTFTASAPERHEHFFRAFTGADQQTNASGDFVFPLDAGRIELVRNTESPAAPLQAPLFTCLTVDVDDIGSVADTLAAENIPFTHLGHTLAIPHTCACGVEIRFDRGARAENSA